MQVATFGQWMKSRRYDLDLKRAQVAQQIGCAEITLSKIESDERRPSKQIAALLAIALDIPNETRESFVQFARGIGDPPVIDGSSTPKTSSNSQPRTNLPAPLNSFVERTSVSDVVREKLLRPDVRLLTLIGPPGIGKTSLSIQAAKALLDKFAEGVWFIPLAPITDPLLVLPAIAHTFDLAAGGASTLLERLQAHLRQRQMLLVLDNFEQVLDAAPHVNDLLKACPKVKIMATSRELLQIYGEHGYPIPVLSLPLRDKKYKVAQLNQFDAIKLFVARAEAVQPGMVLTSDNAQNIVDICLRLDGVPLAIELAAAQLQHYSLPALVNALNNTAPLKALTGAARDIEPRQRTLRNAIQWSYELLSPAERTVFNRLGVFIGGCTTEAAIAVCELFDETILHALADCSLLKRDANERWSMLEMIREFALEQVPAEEVMHTRQQHAIFYLHFLEAMSHKGNYAEFLRSMDVEQHNAQAALRWLINHKDALAGNMAQVMSGYFVGLGLPTNGRQLIREVLSVDIEMSLAARNDLLSLASICAWQQHDFEEALSYAHEALNVSRAMNALPRVAASLIGISAVYIEMDDCVQAKVAALEALQVSRTIQDPVPIVGALDMLGEAELTLGEVGNAATCFEEAFALSQAPEFKQHVYWSHACKGMGEIALSHHDCEHALEFLREGIRRSAYPATQTYILNTLAGVIGTMPHRTPADVCRAAKIWGATEALNEKMGRLNAPGDRRRIDALITKARSRIPPRMFAAAWSVGRELSLDEAIELAMM